MNAPEYPDCLVVINGPEDGTEFPIVRAPVYIGRDSSCAVNVRLDTAVRPFHALVSAVSDGYRVRRTDAAPVYADGKRAGMFRSRIVRSGGLIQVGQTLLCVECAPDGLASRSYGMVTESDFGWTVQQGVRLLFRLSTGIIRPALRIFGRLLGRAVTLLILGFVLYYYWPQIRYHALRLYQQIYYLIVPYFKN